MNTDLDVKTAIVIVTWNSEKDIRECLDPLMELPENWEIWVSDNDSRDATVDVVRSNYPRVQLVENGDNLGFAKGCNAAIRKTNADYVLLLNPDSIAGPEALLGSVNEIRKDKSIGALGIGVARANGELGESAFPFPSLTVRIVESFGLYRFFSDQWKEDNLQNEFFKHDKVKVVDWLGGAFLLMPKAVLDRIDGVPEDYFMFGEDIDLCYKIREMGLNVVFNPKYTVLHKGNQSTGQLPSTWRIEFTTISQYAFCFKYYGWLKTRLIQLVDLAGLNLSIWRSRGNPEKEAQINEWKLYRDAVKKSLRFDRKGTFAFLNSRGQ